MQDELEIGKEVMAVAHRFQVVESVKTPLRPYGETFIRGVIRGERPPEEGAMRILHVERLDAEVTLQQPAHM